MNIALGRAHNPAAIGLRLCAHHRGEAMNFGPPRPRASRIGMGDTGGIYISAIRFKHDAAHPVIIDQRMKPLRLIPADLMKVHPIEFGFSRLQAQLMLTVFGLGQIKASRLKHTAALPGLRFQLIVQCHRVVLNAANIGAVMETVNIGSRMPSRAGRQLVTFQKDNITPAQLGQVVKYRTTNDTATDYNCLSMGPHFGLFRNSLSARVSAMLRDDHCPKATSNV